MNDCDPLQVTWRLNSDSITKPDRAKKKNLYLGTAFLDLNTVHFIQLPSCMQLSCIGD